MGGNCNRDGLQTSGQFLALASNRISMVLFGNEFTATQVEKHSGGDLVVNARDAFMDL